MIKKNQLYKHEILNCSFFPFFVFITVLVVEKEKQTLHFKPLDSVGVFIVVNINITTLGEIANTNKRKITEENEN